MKTLVATLFILAVQTVCFAQINTNIVIISGAGNVNDNAPYDWDSGGYYTNAAGIRAQNTFGNLWQLDGGYFSTNFPYTWYNAGYVSWPAPNPTGVYGGSSSIVVGPPLWSPQFTNYWTLPGDVVSFSAEGRNMAVSNNMTGVEILFDTNIIYQSTMTAGNGSRFSLDGRLQWDGTNISYYAEMASGDPSNVQMAAFGTLSDYTIGTNSFQIVPTGNTNGFVLLGASVTTSRCPQGIATPSGTTTSAPGSTTFSAE